MSSARSRHPEQMTVEEFLEWDAPKGNRGWQLVDGEPRAMSPPSRTHGVLQSEMAFRLTSHLRQGARWCSVVTGPGVVPRLFSRHNMRVPDIAVTCTRYVAEERALTDPVLLIEILSPSNEGDTWSNVWTYTTIPTVQEVLVLHTDRIAAEVLRRRPDGAWPAETETIESGSLALHSLDFAIDIAALYIDTRLTAGG